MAASEAPVGPNVELPKGGGAIRGIGEKFGANPVTGTGSMTAPIATSPGREGFGPDLSLSYDSGTGNGPFGFGWSLSLPAIARKTDKGLPQYRDAGDSDVYVLSGAEDLVPVLHADGTRLEDAATAPGYVIHRFRPRVEGLFARIERWTSVATHEIHWRTITRDNVTTLYGKDNRSRIFDPADPASAHPTRVFRWLICESYDAKGNVIVYEYVAENDDGVDCRQVHERNRTTPARAANRYPKRIRYGNRVSRLVEPDLTQASWMFEVVFDYGEAHLEDVGLDAGRPEAEQHRFLRASASAGRPWTVRPDPFSSHRAGFEVRTYRRCHRVLMFHHIPDLPTGQEGYDGLVRSTEFGYADLDYTQAVAIDDELAHQGSTRFASFIRTISQAGYVRDDGQATVLRDGVQYATYLEKALPPLEFEYSKAVIDDRVRELDASSLENLPAGLAEPTYRLVDLDGEGVSGVLTEQAGAWFYKPNLGDGHFGPLRTVATQPSVASLTDGSQQLLDLAGDGQLDLVSLAGPIPGFYERTQDEGWEPFRPFQHLPNLDWADPNLRFVDLDGDGLTDILITEESVFTWHESLAEEGFGPARRVPQPHDEERGPRLVVADGTQSIYLADMSGDDLADLVRIRNGEVCYWPNVGYGRFGPKVTMDNGPWFDHPDQFDQRRVRLADIDGSGTNDIMYLSRGGARLYFNQSGNRISEARRLAAFPCVDNVASVVTADLLGNGTACLVWSSPLPSDAGRPVRYIDLMGAIKPHLLVRSINNLGAETHIHYAPSTRFYLADKRNGRHWATRLPFPVHVVERVVTLDRVSGNRFSTRYAYHHGHFDGIEREFRGFGMVEQWDTERFAALDAGGEAPDATNVEASSHGPPILTKTWFHTGVYLGREHVSDFFAGLLDADNNGEYYREPGLSDAQAGAVLLDDTMLPDGLTFDEEREACRALKGSVLRQEVYGLDGTHRQQHPYTVIEQTFGIRVLQARGRNRHAVFLTHPRESVTYHYERDPADPRIGHVLTLDVDEYGNVLRTAAIGYGRRHPDPTLSPADQAKQTQILINWTDNRVTNAVEDAHDHRAPLPCESRAYELTGLSPPPYLDRFNWRYVLEAGKTAIALGYEEEPTAGLVQKRLIEHVRTYYRGDDLARPLPLGDLQSLALPFESYKLAFTPGLIARVFGTRATDSLLEWEGGYVHSQGDANWWIPSGQSFYSENADDTPPQELAHARQHFFLRRRYRDQFHTQARSTESFVTYDRHDLLVEETRDALGNRVTVGERSLDPTQPPRCPGHDYRVLQPAMVMDANRNRSAVAFDALGMVVGSAVMGKPEESPVPGDRLTASFRADLTEAEIDRFMADPTASMATKLLDDATTRVVYDLTAYRRAPDPAKKRPTVAVTLSRETHASEPSPAGGSRIQVSLAYSDGFGRAIQKKIQAEPGPVPARAGTGRIVVGTDGQPELTSQDVTPRWVCSGWTVFNNKGKPVRQYEPFFTRTHRFEFDFRIGVSPVFFYDPVERLVATLHPNHTWDKVIVDPWRQETWDVNDTVLVADPSTDADVGAQFARLAGGAYMPTWYALRTDPTHAPDASRRWPDPRNRSAERRAAQKTAIHAATPTVVNADTQGRVFLTAAQNKVKYSDTVPADPPIEDVHRTRILLDIEGNQREVVDADDRVVVRYDYDMLGNRVHQASMEAGQRTMLNDVVGKSLVVWDSRDHRTRTAYDALRRPTHFFLREREGDEVLVGRNVYGEGRPDPEASNLRGKLVEVFDQAGSVIEDEYDFKGNRLRSRRQLAQSYATTLDWSGAVALQVETYVSATTYDAFNRPTQVIAPHSDQPGATVNVIQPLYNEASLLEQVHAWLSRDAAPEERLDPATANLNAVTNIDYDAKGRRERIVYGNGAVTTYDYDPFSSNLVRLLTRRDAAAFPDDCPGPPPSGWLGCQVQNLHYTYDPAGNITYIRDDAQQIVFFRNKRVEPSCDYTYDAVYRLVEATGREHLGQVGGSPLPHSYDDRPRVGVLHPGDGNAMGRFLERYVYDAVGGFLQMQHRGSDPSHAGWTRRYGYDEASLTEPAKRSNRLTRTILGNATTETYSTGGDGYDAHGNMLRMPHLQAVQWTFRDALQMTSRQAVNAADVDGVQHEGERTWYVYNAAGQRVRKVTESQTGRVHSERLYLGGFEVYRRHGADPLTRETLHLADEEQRIALVETRTEGDDDAPVQLIRYQFANHLGSASLELDDQAGIISYEEYTPYGSTAYQAVRSQTEAPPRYRHTAKERDEESGFYYAGARYYAPWLGRWQSADPAGIADGTNLYGYCRANPIRHRDATGSDSEEDQPSLWNRFTGGLKMVGGALETVAGAGLVAAGAATSELGIGIPIAAAGYFVGAHGLDTTVSGARTLWNGTQVDTFTSQGLQLAGMTRTTANLADATISIAGTFGANMATRAPAVATVALEGPSVSISHAAGAPSALGVANPVGYAVGHTRVGVNLGEGAGTVWSHLTVPGERVMMSSGGLVESGTAVISEGSTLAPKFASVVTIPRTAAQASAAQSVVTSSVGEAGAYGFLANDCTTYGMSVMNAAGVGVSGSTPATLFVSAALRSEAPVSTLLTSATVMQPVTTAGMITNTAVGVSSLTTTSTAGPVSTQTSSSNGSGIPDPEAFRTFQDFQATAPSPYSQDFLMQTWASVRGWVSAP